MFRSLLLTSVLVLGACASCSKSKKEEPGGVTGNDPVGAKVGGMKKGELPAFPAGATPESYDTETFTVTYAAAATATGGQAIVQVKPKKPFHLNHEFPTELELKAPEGVDLKGKTLWENNPDKQEAAVWMDEHGAFAVDFGVADKTAVVGKRIDATFRFAVCTEVSCDPKSAEFAMVIATP